jgi:prepilin-type N-terminal cleavage/methylation domain-containing protein
MAQKYTILKVIIQNSSKINKTSKGFTLIELIVGMSIMLIVGGLAMNALVQSSSSFNKDKRTIDSSQSASAILEIIGNDIKQSGENINDAKFPTIEFKVADATLDPTLKTGSSKIIIRRSLISPLTLCEKIDVNQSFTTGTNLTVASNLNSTVTASANCDVGTASSPLSVYRIPTTVTAPLLTPATTPVTTQPTITTYYPQAVAGLNPYPTAPTPLALKLPQALRKARDYRCNTDPNTVYDNVTNTGTDFCSLVPNAKLRIAISNSNGQFLVFNQTDEVASSTPDTVANETVVNDNVATATAPTKKYQITIGKSTSTPVIPYVPADAVANNTKNIAVPYVVTTPATTIAYPIGSPIYVIEERVYTLTSDNKLQLSINGEAAQTLVKKIDNFRVSAKIYTDSTNRIVQPTPATNICSNATPFADQPVVSTTAPISPSVDNPKYICQFNYFTTTGTADWKTLAGIKVEIQTKYDGTGQDAEATNSAQVIESKKKLYAASEFFPRNVLSK